LVIAQRGANGRDGFVAAIEEDAEDIAFGGAFLSWRLDRLAARGGSEQIAVCGSVAGNRRS
jgi:hypothetical protein